MRNTLLPIAALLASVAMLFMANGLLGVLLPLHALFIGYSSFEIGVLGTTYFAGFFAGCLLGPRLVRRVGHIRSFAALVGVICALVLLMGLTEARPIWWLARGVIGACFATSFIVIESWLNDRATNSNRGFVFSVYTIVNLTVITLGQLAIMLASIEDLQLFAVAAMLVSLATLPVVVSAAQAPTPPETVNVRLGYLFRRSRVAMVACVGVGIANGSFWMLGPLFGQRESAGVEATAIFMSLTVIAGALGQWPLGHLSDNMDRRWVIVLAGLGASLGAAVLVGLPATGMVTTYAGAVLFGAFAFPMYALCAAHLNDFIEPDGFVEAASGLLMAYAVGAMIGPLLASALMGWFGVASLFVFTAVVHLAIAVYALHRIRIKEPTSEAGQASFADALVMTSMAAEIDILQQDDDEELDTSVYAPVVHRDDGSVDD